MPYCCTRAPHRLFLAVLSLMTPLLLLPPNARAGTYTWQTTDANGRLTAQSPTYTGGQVVFSGGPGPDLTYNYSGGYGNGPDRGVASDINCSGAITATFTWQPDAGKNMDTDPPPDQVMVQETSYALTNATGTDASPPTGECSNGLGISQSLILTTDPNYPGQVSGHANCSSTRYTLHAGGPTVMLPTCSPVAHSANTSSQSKVHYSAVLFPIVISAPDPLGRPDLGDGKNQRVYGAQQPDGYLYVPGAARAVGASAPAMQWLLASQIVDMAIDNSVIPNTFVHGWTVSGDTLFINTPQNTDNPYPNYQFNSWIFKGLPSQNSNFGDHDVNLYVQNKKAQTAKIQTFFNGLAKNWPNTDNATPNWYHYYNQVYPSAPVTFDANLTGPAGETTPADPNTKDYSWDPPASYYVRPNEWVYPYLAIGPAVMPSYDLGVFDLDGSVLGLPSRKYVRYIGSLSMNGIFSYINAVSHEKAHVTLIQRGICYPWSSKPPLQFEDEQGIVRPYTDSDRDTLDDGWELGHHLLPTNPDTTGHFSNYTDPKFPRFGTGDLEALAEVLVLKSVFDNISLWKSDWSDRGVQYGDGIHLYYTPPDFYFDFTAAVNGTSFVAGTVYHIRSLQDLQSEYPTLLTDVP